MLWGPPGDDHNNSDEQVDELAGDDAVAPAGVGAAGTDTRIKEEVTEKVVQDVSKPPSDEEAVAEMLTGN